MNVNELSSQLYRRSGVDAEALKRLGSSRRTDRPQQLGEEHSDGPKFSQVLAELAEKHAPESLRAAQTTTSQNGNALRSASDNSMSVEKQASAAEQTAAGKRTASASEQSAAGNNAADKKSSLLSDKQIRSILKNALNSDTISSDIVDALTGENGEISDKLLDMILDSGSEDDEDEDIFSGGADAALNRMLTDRQTAQEYLSSRSGRNLIVALADRSLSGLIS